MGITGLLPMLEKSKVSRPANIKEFEGCTVAADAYCWLHKGAFSCADKLARGEQTDMYVQFCMKYVNMLLANGIKPILVFDGRHLPAKAHTEKKRRERREENRKQAANLLRQGHTTEALSFLRRCIDVTHKMALTVMQECRRRNVDCIVAPYEADAQLAFFSLEGIADVIVTEDSDLLLFGCKKVLFKLDLAGNGILVDQDKLYLSMGPRPETYSFDKFRYMCILSGCDYLDSLPGIGLGKACKFISRTQDPDIHKALCRLPSQLNIRGLTVSPEYRDEFLKANAMFKHQLVFDTIMRKARPLTPHQSVHPGSPLAGGPLPGCVPEFDEETSYQLALGNLDPFKLEKVDEYDPYLPRNENQGVKTQGWSQTAVAPHPSIWDPKFIEKAAKPVTKVAPSFMPSDSRPMTKGITRAVDTKDLVKQTRKRPLEEDAVSAVAKRHSIDRIDMLTSLYTSPVSTKTSNVPSLPTPESPDVSSSLESPTSPVFSGKKSKNPFSKSAKSEDVDEYIKEEKSSNPPTRFGALNKFARATQRTSTEGKPIVQSRYFKGSSVEETKDPASSLLRDVSNTIEDNVDIMDIYRKNSDEQPKAKIHKRPLFASISSAPKEQSEESENDNQSKCTSFPADAVLKNISDKFKKVLCPVLKTSPSKNPFKKDDTVNKGCDSVDNPLGECEGFKYQQVIADEDENCDVDDPGFESSASLTPCTPNKVFSQPDDGFESPSKTSCLKKSPSAVTSKQPTPRQSKPSCRTPGLKKSSVPAQGQSKLSAFGFTPKPKIQRS